MGGHTDSPMVGRCVRITSYNGNSARVTGFIKKLGTFNTIPIVNYDVVSDCESTVKSIILFMHNGLYFKGVNRNLIPPLMMKLDDLEVD